MWIEKDVKTQQKLKKYNGNSLCCQEEQGLDKHKKGKGLFQGKNIHSSCPQGQIQPFLTGSTPCPTLYQFLHKLRVATPQLRHAGVVTGHSKCREMQLLRWTPHCLSCTWDLSYLILWPVCLLWHNHRALDPKAQPGPGGYCPPSWSSHLYSASLSHHLSCHLLCLFIWIFLFHF